MSTSHSAPKRDFAKSRFAEMAITLWPLSFLARSDAVALLIVSLVQTTWVLP
jgi:hypothetical protein